MPADHQRGLVDTNIVILRHRLDAEALPAEVAISAITLAELTAGVHAVRGDDDEARRERAARTEVLQRAENEFDPFPFGVDAARMFGRMSAAVQDAGRSPRRRAVDLMIAATAAVEGLPLYTTNATDFAGLASLVTVVAVPLPEVA